MKRAIAATLMLWGVDALEQRVLGRTPAYNLYKMSKRLFGTERYASLLRWTYGPAVGWLQRKLRTPPLLFGPLVALGELVALPLIGATPPVRKWRKGEVPLLFAHATAFALAAR